MLGPSSPSAGGDERRFFGQPTEPEHERHQAQEDEDAHADHLRGIAERWRGRVPARVLHHLPHVPVLADPRAREAHEPHEPGERHGQDEEGVLGTGRHLAPLDHAQSLGVIKWGQMPPRSQYALFILAVTFTWLMGLMGFARSGIRQYWHVWQVVQDTSRYAATPALGYASKMISVCVLIFLCLVSFVFWLGGLAEKSTFVASGGRRGGAQHVGH